MGLSVSIVRIESPDVINQFDNEESMFENGLSVHRDMGEEQSLYDALEEALHPFVFKSEGCCFDEQVLEQRFGEPVEVVGLDDEGWVLSNGQCLAEADMPTKMVPCNAVVTRELLYLGGSASFDDSIFEAYNAKKAFHAWFGLKEGLTYFKHYGSVQERIETIVQENRVHPERVFIDLGY